MTVVTLKGFAAGETVNAYLFAKGEPFIRQYGQTPPGVPAMSGSASATGVWFPDLPDNTEYIVYGVTSKVAKHVLNAVTQGGSAPWAPV